MATCGSYQAEHCCQKHQPVKQPKHHGQEKHLENETIFFSPCLADFLFKSAKKARDPTEKDRAESSLMSERREVFDTSNRESKK